MSCPAEPQQRRSVVSVTTTRTSFNPDSPDLQRRLPSVRFGLAEDEADLPSARRGVSLVIERSDHKRSQKVTHTITVDAWLFILLFFLLLTPTSAYTLTGTPTLSGPPRSSFLHRPSHLNMFVESPDPGFAQVKIPLDLREDKDITIQSDGSIPARWQKVPECDRPKKWRTTMDDAACALLKQPPQSSPDSVRKAIEKAFDGSDKKALKQMLKQLAPKQLYTSAELSNELANLPAFGMPTVLVFGAKACRTCKAVQPRAQQMASQAGAQFRFIHHNTATQAAFVEHGITQTPTIHVYDGEGNLVNSNVYTLKTVKDLGGVLDGVQKVVMV